MEWKEMSEALEELREWLVAFNDANGGNDEVQRVSILGTEYNVLVRSVEEDPKLEQCVGYCEQYSKKIVLNDMAGAEKDLMVVEDI